MKSILINILLCIVAVLLFFPLYIVNAIVVIAGGGAASGFFRSTALSIDRYANYEFRTLFNKVLIKPNAPKHFGNFNETISYVLAININAKSLTVSGVAVCWLIDKMDKGHFEKTILEVEKKEKDVTIFTR